MLQYFNSQPLGLFLAEDGCDMRIRHEVPEDDDALVHILGVTWKGFLLVEHAAMREFQKAMDFSLCVGGIQRCMGYGRMRGYVE
jgi:hypothetical protein